MFFRSFEEKIRLVSNYVKIYKKYARRLKDNTKISGNSVECNDISIGSDPSTSTTCRDIYGTWYNTVGKSGEKPTGDILKAYELFDAMKATTDLEERERLAKQITDFHAENIWIIGTVGETLQPVVVKNNFRNVPTELIRDDPLRTPGNAEPAQFFIKQK